jgi:YihY family inner membrane protein
MSSATYVPPITELDASDIKPTLRETSLGEFSRDSFLRFRKSDGFSFARSLAFQVVLAVIPGLIMVVGIADWIGEGRFQTLIREGITTLAPGPASEMFLQAFDQGSVAASSGSIWPIIGGGSAALVSAVTAMAQLQRGASRIYGVQTDRTTFKRYALATLLTVTVGLALTIAFILIVLGSTIGGDLQDRIAQTWAWARWPLGLVLLTGGLALLFKAAPNRPQPGFGWLALGGSVATVGWLLVSLALASFLNASRLFGETYGPLAGFMGLVLWAQFSGIVILYGLAVAAQLEAIQANVDEPVEEDAHPESSQEAVLS